MGSRGKQLMVDGVAVIVSYRSRREQVTPRVQVDAVDGRAIGYWDLERCVAVAVAETADDGLVRGAAEVWERAKPAERDLFRAQPEMRPSASTWLVAVTTEGGAVGGPATSGSTRMRLLPEPHPREDMAGNKPGQQLRALRRDVVRADPIGSFAGLFNGAGDLRNQTFGLRGELMVAKRLEAFCKRNPHWYVLHSITRTKTGTDVDHLVIGPAGVYSINTKHWRTGSVVGRGRTVRKVSTNGGRFADAKTLKAAAHEGRAVSKLLSRAVEQSVAVAPLVVVAGPAQVSDGLRHDGVRLLHESTVESWFDAQASLPPVHDADSVAALHRAARHRSTWLPGS